MKLYKVNREYIKYLNDFDNQVMRDDKERARLYVGYVRPNKRINYVIPLSSPKLNIDYVINNGSENIINENDCTIKFIESISKEGKLEVIGKLMLGKMIPVPHSELESVNINNFFDSHYQSLVIKELDFINKHYFEIKRICEKTIYKAKNINQDLIDSDIRKCVDFNLAEKKYREWEYNLKMQNEDYKSLFNELDNMNASEELVKEVKHDILWGYDLDDIRYKLEMNMYESEYQHRSMKF